VIAFNGWKKGWMNKLVTGISVCRTLNTLKRENDLVGLLSFWVGGCALVGKYYAKWNSEKHFTWILGQDARKGNRLIPLIRPTAGELVALSNFLADEFDRNYKVRPLHIIPNGVDPSLYAPGDRLRDIDILGVGSLIPLKQYDLFIDVIQELSRILPGIRSVICGKGPEEGRLQAAIQQLDLPKNVALAGEVSHRKALGYMQRAKILLHTSSYEGFSTVCLEALYAGAQVISFCDPVGSKVKNWHIVNSKEEMIGCARKILQDSLTDYSSVQVHTMDESAKGIMALYDYNETAISSL
jgi:glycosyltransferase involved in cell wall biosynthesis